MDNQMMIDINKIETDLSSRLSEKLFAHCKRVAAYAGNIASFAGIDPDKMYIAGLLHDVAVELSREEVLELCDKVYEYIPQSAKKDGSSRIFGGCIFFR